MSRIFRYKNPGYSAELGSTLRDARVDDAIWTSRPRRRDISVASSDAAPPRRSLGNLGMGDTPRYGAWMTRYGHRVYVDATSLSRHPTRHRRVGRCEPDGLNRKFSLKTKTTHGSKLSG